MNKQQLLKDLNKNIYCKLAPSKIHGVGVFAVRDIPKGTDPLLGAYKGSYKEFTHEEIEKLDKGVQEIISELLIEKNGKVLIPICGLNRLDISYYLNHSDKPNMLADENTDTYKTLRTIKKGEELTINYIEYCGENLQEKKAKKKKINKSP